MWSRVVLGAIAAVCLVLVCPSCDGLMRLAVDFERLEQINGTDLFSLEKMRVRKYNSTQFVLNGTATLLKDLDDGYEYSFSFARSAQGNNQYAPYPMKLASKPMCEFLNSYYKDYYPLFGKYTNFPAVPKEGRLCPLPAGGYWVKDMFIDTSSIPAWLPDGYWCCIAHLRFFETGQTVSGVALYVRISKVYVFE